MKFSRKLKGMAKSSDSPVKILLADDSVTMHRAVSLALKKESYDLICVDNGKDALRLIYEHRPAIALLDLDMPEKTGIEVAQAIREDSSLSGTQIVLLCGSFDEVNEKDVEKAPVDARLWKPFESHVLLAMLRTLLSAKNKPASRSEASSAIEATAPLANESENHVHEETAETIFNTQLPKFAPPKSRKDWAMEKASDQVEERFETVQGISPSKAREMKEAVEATRPISVNDLFNPTKKPVLPKPPAAGASPTKPSFSPPPLPISEEEDDDSDFSRSLTRETFGESRPLPDELPPPLESNEPTLEAKSKERAQPKEDPFVNNLWDPEEISSMEEKTEFPNEGLVEDSLHLGSEEEQDQTGDYQNDFEILSPQSESRTTAHGSFQSPDWLNSTGDEEASKDSPFGTLEEEATRIAVENISQAPEYTHHSDNSPAGSLGTRVGRAMPETASNNVSGNPDQLRKMVELEVRRVFQDWLHDELKRQLNEVMAELEDELR